MSIQLPPPRLFIPPSAPFSPEQQAWLNGFFAAILSVEGAPEPLNEAENAALASATAADAALGRADNDEAPWHDASMPIEERMSLSVGRPLAPRLMSAMAQQDCGQCGYNCADYANAIALKKEERLTLCAPGGKETARRLKQFAAELDATPAAPAILRPSVSAAMSEIGRSRDNPAEARFLSRRRLNGEGSAKTTWHVEFDLTGSGLDYEVGDSFGVSPRNHPALADQVVATLGADPQRRVGGKTLRDALIEDASLGTPPDSLFQLLSYVLGGEKRAKVRALANGEDPDGDAETLDVLAALRKFDGRPDAEAFLEALDPLQPRLYSISSSPKANPCLVSLTVDTVRYRVSSRERLGVASTFLGERIQPGETLKVYVQKAHGFRLPANPATPVIMIGPGTGVAPFRAFLQERQATSAPGANWLFFGHQRRQHDFFYESEFEAMRKAGALARLSLAWSRDDADKFYVQDRMRESGLELWRWIGEGAHLYVCGDAKRMAKDVERAVVDIVAQGGARSTEDAIGYVAALKKAGRYQTDVY